MRITEKEVFMSYIQNNLTRYENDVIALKQRLRYRDIDIDDCFELALAIERLTMFQEFARNSLIILHIIDGIGNVKEYRK